MDQSKATRAAGMPRRPSHLRAVLILGAVLVSSFSVAGCTQAPNDTAGMATMATGAATTGSSQATTAPTAGGGQGMAMVPSDAGQAWASRPAFTRTSRMTEEAYAYALYHPQLMQYIPCYCGCAGMGHRSNLDCYYQKAIPGKPTTFEEHASFCDVCVRITLTVKTLTSEGKSLRDIRAVVDTTFGGAAPGTPTELPPI